MTECRACGSQATSPFFRLNQFRAYKCGACGVVFTIPGTEIRAEKEFSEIDLQNYFEYFEGFRRKYFAENLAIIEEFTAKGRILDIGCSFGWFVDEARKRGWDAYGIEPSARAVDFARSKYTLDVRPGDAEHIDFPEGFFNAVTLWNVFEHLPDPGKVLQTVRTRLAKDGVLVLCVPDINGILNRLVLWLHKCTFGAVSRPLRIAYQCDYSSPHLFHYSGSSMKKLVERNGFSLLKIRRQDIVNTEKIGERLAAANGLGLGMTAARLAALSIRLLQACRKDEMVFFLRKE